MQGTDCGSLPSRSGALLGEHKDALILPHEHIVTWLKSILETTQAHNAGHMGGPQPLTEVRDAGHLTGSSGMHKDSPGPLKGTEVG